MIANTNEERASKTIQILLRYRIEVQALNEKCQQTWLVNALYRMDKNQFEM